MKSKRKNEKVESKLSPLLTTLTVIFKKRILIESGTWEKLKFWIWVSKIVHYISWFLRWKTIEYLYILNTSI